MEGDILIDMEKKMCVLDDEKDALKKGEDF